MRWIVWYIKSAFCKHEWEVSEDELLTYHPEYSITTRNMIATCSCKKCMWHKKYKKILRGCLIK